MTGTGGDGLPVEFTAKGIKGGRDLLRRAPAHSIVIAAEVEGTHVFHAVEEMHRAIAGGDGDGVVDRLLVGAAHVFALLLGRHVRIARQSRPHVGDLFRG